MLTLITVFHLILALFLIVFVLLQDPKGGGAFGMGGGGGSAQSVFGASGAGNFLVSATKSIAILFTVTCIVLSYMTLQKGTSVMEVTDQLPAAGAGAFSTETPATEETPKTEK